MVVTLEKRATGKEEDEVVVLDNQYRLVSPGSN